ncbi:MAG: AMP-binding protein [Clostridia bacterium]|nr:AMP-binding protein [Clostridia bacterium]
MGKKYKLNNFKELADFIANRDPNGICIKWLEGDEEITRTYSKFRSDIDALGTYFYYNGLKNARIAVIGENSYNWILTYYATVIGGNVIVPIDRDLTADAIINVLKDSEAKALIYTDSYKKIIDDIAKATGVKPIHVNQFEEILEEGRELLEKGKDKYLKAEIDNDEMSTLIYTSGTTGTPKGVMLSQRNIVSNACNVIEYEEIYGTSMLVLPIHHTFGFTASVVAVMIFGQPIAINTNLRTFLPELKIYKPQSVYVVPMFIEAIYKKIWKNIEQKKLTAVFKGLIKTSNALRKVGIDKRKSMFKSVTENFGGNLTLLVSGGAPLDPTYVNFFDAIGVTLLNGYGITECSPIVAVNPLDNIKHGSVGMVLPDTEVKIIDKDENGNGEICVAGSGVMLGYYKNKEATEEAFEDRWFKTGDLGHLDEDNFLYISGRKKNLIILNNGKNIYPEEIEEMIMRIPEVIEVVVYSENDVMTAEVYTENEDAVNTAIRNLNKSLPNYKAIKNIKFRQTEFEKTTTKKIKRNTVVKGN